MASKKETLGDMGLFILRIGTGLQLAFLHGLDKARHFAERMPTWADPLNLGHKRSLQLTVAAEFFCALLLVLGLASRLAALTIAFSLAVMMLLVHRADPWGQREATVLYFCAAMAILLLGPGRFSIDRVVSRSVFSRLFSKKGSARAAGPEV